MNWYYKKFDELTRREIFEIYKARCAVFVVEQNCHYQDVDEIDLEAFHLLLTEDEKLAAYCRIYTLNGRVKIGRVLIIKDYRGRGLGRDIMKKAIDFIKNHWEKPVIEIQAQAYLKDFYQSFGFKAISAEYLDAGIAHIDMILE